jgi:hypothetical protein
VSHCCEATVAGGASALLAQGGGEPAFGCPGVAKAPGLFLVVGPTLPVRRMQLNGGEGLPEPFLCYYSVCGGKGDGCQRYPRNMSNAALPN